MTGAEWVVAGGAAAAIAAINWYFFGERRAATALATVAGVVEVPIAVKGGYQPSAVRVKQGSTVRLVLDRQETSSCSEEIVLPEFGIRRFLPAYQKTTIELKADKEGSFDFTCGMGMLHGRLIVEGNDDN